MGNRDLSKGISKKRPEEIWERGTGSYSAACREILRVNEALDWKLVADRQESDSEMAWRGMGKTGTRSKAVSVEQPCYGVTHGREAKTLTLYKTADLGSENQL